MVKLWRGGRGRGREGEDGKVWVRLEELNSTL